MSDDQYPPHTEKPRITFRTLNANGGFRVRSENYGGN